jgi:hypothetical protein
MFPLFRLVRLQSDQQSSDGADRVQPYAVGIPPVHRPKSVSANVETALLVHVRFFCLPLSDFLFILSDFFFFLLYSVQHSHLF